MSYDYYCDSPFEHKCYSEPAYVNDGDWVWLPWNREKRSALRCKVLTAAGYNARVVNEEYGVDMWVRIEHLLVPPHDPRCYPSDREDQDRVDRRNRKRFQSRSARTLALALPGSR